MMTIAHALQNGTSQNSEWRIRSSESVRRSITPAFMRHLCDELDRIYLQASACDID